MKEQFPSLPDKNIPAQHEGLKSTLKKALVGVSAFALSHPALAKEAKLATTHDAFVPENTRSYEAPDTTIGNKDSIASYHSSEQLPDSAEVIRMYGEHKAEYDARYGETIVDMAGIIPNLSEGDKVIAKRFTIDGPVEVKVVSGKDGTKIKFPGLESFKAAHPDYYPYVADAMKKQTYDYMKDKVFEKIIEAARLEADKESMDIYVPTQKEIDIVTNGIGDGYDMLFAYYTDQMKTPEQEIAFYKKYKHRPDTMVRYMMKKYLHPEKK